MDWDSLGTLFLFLCSFGIIRSDPFEYSDCWKPQNEDELNSNHFFQFKVFGLNYDEFNFNDYKGRVMFAVNVASF